MENEHQFTTLFDKALLGAYGRLPAATCKAYTRDARHFAKWYARLYGEPFTPGVLSLDAITRYRDYCRTRVSAGTFNRRHAALSWLGEWAVMHKLLDANPIQGVRCAKVCVAANSVANGTDNDASKSQPRWA